MAWDTDGTRRRLKEAATAEFAEYGLAGTTMTQIAARAGINKERLYSYYGDKAALWEAVLADELNLLAAAVTLDPGDDIGEFVGETYDFHANRPELARLLQWEGLSRQPAVRADARAEHYRQKVAAIARAQTEGKLDASLAPGPLLFSLIALAAWWHTVPQLAELVTGAASDVDTESARRRSFVVDAARRLADPR